MMDLVGHAVLWALTYLSLVYCYVFGFYNVCESTRRVRLLIELLAAGDRGLTLLEIGGGKKTRIEMPDDWKGHPQRKDYPLGGIPVEYRGTKVPPPDERRSYS